jgi:lysyl-tRNA synthetase class 2
MRRKPIDSTSLKSVGYEPSTHTLEIEFHGGRVYRYFGVPPRRYRALLDAESAGRFLNAEIKGVYACTRMSP